MNNLRALELLRRNITALLAARHESQSDLAGWLSKDKSWMNKFLNGHRGIQLKDLDRIADFFGLATYQLFQPGIMPLTERRSGRDRRSGHDRRIGHQHRELASLADIVASLRPGVRRGSRRPIPADAPQLSAELRAEITDLEQRISAIIAKEARPVVAPVPRPRPRHRSAGGPDDPSP